MLSSFFTSSKSLLSPSLESFSSFCNVEHNHPNNTFPFFLTSSDGPTMPQPEFPFHVLLTTLLQHPNFPSAFESFDLI